MASKTVGGPQLFASPQSPQALQVLPADRRLPFIADQAKLPLMETKSSSDKDLVITLLNKIVEEHASLRGLVQQQHESLSQRLEELSTSLPSGKMLLPGVPVHHAQQDPLSPHISPATAALAEKEQLSKSEKHVASGQSSWHRDKQKKEDKKKAVETLEVQEPPPLSLPEKIVSSPYFDILMGVTILANTFIMFVGIQMEGLHFGWKLGERDTDPNWTLHQRRFLIAEDIFNSLYLGELLLRLAVSGRRFVYQYSNVVDAVIVVFSCFDSFVLQRMAIQTVNISVLRLARLTRVFRVAKVLRGAAMFSELRILISTLTVAVRGIMWSVFLLAGFVVTGGILMSQLAFNFFDNESIDLETRLWLYENFGTTFISIYTMFECTFTGGWRFFSRPLITDVHYLFAVFWILWIILVNFMTMRVVGALFLKSTLAVAAQSDERLAMQAQKKKKEIGEKIEELFKAADETGDGCLGVEEFEAMLSKQEVIDAFAEMGLDMDELYALFSVLSSDDGSADYEEFMTGALSMTASSPQLDTMKSAQNQLKLACDIHLVLDQTLAIRKTLSSLTG
jgi:hypothetical protein